MKVEIELEKDNDKFKTKYTTHCDRTWFFICADWMKVFFGLSCENITVCFSDKPCTDSYFFRITGLLDDHVTVYKGNTARSAVLFNGYAYSYLRKFIYKHFPEAEAHISVYLEGAPK